MTATQTAIQHAVIARSVRQVKTDQIYKKHTVDDETLLALSYADKSIVCRRNELNRHESSREHRVTVMTTFFLLALLAFYQRDILATLCHMAAGYKMLQDWAAVDKENSPNRIALKNAFSQFRIAAAIFLISETFPIGERLVCFEPSGTISDDTIVLHEVEINTQIMMIIGSLFVEMNPARGFKVPAVTPNFRHNGAGAWAQMRLGRANNEIGFDSQDQMAVPTNP